MPYVVRTYSGEQTFEDSDSAADYIVENDDYLNDYDCDYNPDEDLNDIYGSIEICGREYYAAEILYELNEDGYNEFANDQRYDRARDSKDEIEYEIDQLSPGESTSFAGGITVTYEDDIDDNDATSADGFAEVFDYAM